MSEPLNNFLESVEGYINDPRMTDAELGCRLRSQWTDMIEAEKVMDEFCKKVHCRREPVAVKIPGQ